MQQALTPFDCEIYYSSNESKSFAACVNYQLFTHKTKSLVIGVG